MAAVPLARQLGASDRAAMARISSVAELENWLEDRREGWSAAVACRLVLRALPFAADHPADEASARLIFVAVRCNAISWAAGTYPVIDISSAAYAAALAARSVSDSVIAGDTAYAGRAAAALVAAMGAAAAAAAGIASPFVAAQAAAANGYVGQDRAAHWSAVADDCDWIRGREENPFARLQLTRSSLWLGQASIQWLEKWQSCKAAMLAIDPGYSVWIDWFDRRIRGERAAFDIPGDRGRKEEEEEAILRKLAVATDEDFWDKGAPHVNATLQQWIDEARERVAKGRDTPKPEPAPQAAVPDLPAQNPNALQFTRSEAGKIALLSHAGADELKTDRDARDRHKEVVDLARALLAQCDGINTAGRLVHLLSNYLVAAGDEIEDMRPSLFVQRGERLRQELAAYDAADTTLPPLSDALRLDLQNVCKTHNMIVALDPALLARDTAQLGPDRTVAEIPPEEIRDRVREADASGFLEPEVVEVSIEATILVPAGADASDRRFRWSAASCQNLIIEMFTLVLNKPRTTALVAAGLGVIGPTVLLGNALACGTFLVKHRRWIEDRLARHAPTWNSLLADLYDWIEANTPLGRERH